MQENIMPVNKQKANDDAANGSKRGIKKPFIEPVLTRHERLDENTLGGGGFAGGVTLD